MDGVRGNQAAWAGAEPATGGGAVPPIETSLGPSCAGQQLRLPRPVAGIALGIGCVRMIQKPAFRQAGERRFARFTARGGLADDRPSVGQARLIRAVARGFDGVGVGASGTTVTLRPPSSQDGPRRFGSGWGILTHPPRFGAGPWVNSSSTRMPFGKQGLMIEPNEGKRMGRIASPGASSEA